MGGRIPFDEVDPFNGVRVRGWVRRDRRRRGDLEITHVEGTPCAQYIHGTPRIRHLDAALAPKGEGRVYDKVDGSNILLFRYRDAAGQVLSSFKTRLSPFLRAQPYGDFVALWREIMERYADELDALSPVYSWGFELFGARLRILTDYEEELDARLLFALDPQSGDFVSPSALDACAFPAPKLVRRYSPDMSALEIQAQTLAHYSEAFDRGEKVEGAVVYFDDGGATSAFKCTPPQVQGRQAQYRRLYDHGRSLVRSGATDAAIMSALAKMGAAMPSRIVDIACEDIRHEMTFNAEADHG